MNTADHHFAVTIFPDTRAMTLQEKQFALHDLADLLRTTCARAKDELPLAKLAQFGGARTISNSLRNDANMLTISGIEGDYDAGEVDPKEAVEALEEAGVRAVVATTPRHAPSAPRWRAFCPFSRPLEPRHRRRMVDRLNGILGGILAPESWTASQSYYVGRVATNDDFEVHTVQGDFIDLLDALDAGAIGKPGDKRKTNGAAPPDDDDLDDFIDRRLITEPELAAALAKMPNDPAQFSDGARWPAWFDRTVWIKLAHAIAGATERAGWARTLFIAWSAKFDNGDPTSAARAWDTLSAEIRAGFSTIVRIYEGWNGRWSFPSEQEQQADTASSATGNQQTAEQDAPPPAFTDEALALRFAEIHADDLCHVAAWNQWLHSDGSRWKPEETLRAFDFARRICRQTAAGCKKVKIAAAITSARSVAAVVSLARSDRRLAATPDQWDADPWLLNTPGGTVNLHTGNIRPHDRLDYITKVTAVTPAAPGTPHSVWTSFLNRVMGEDPNLIAFVQRFFGYALTADTSEHCFVFAHGGGANGKGTMLRTMSGILCDYATVASMETFIETRTEHHPTDVAKLAGARLVTAQETQKGRKWDETKIKALTGGDMITARRMRQDFFDFAPTFKLLIAGNHRPRLANVDEAMRRRLILLPFEVTISEPERDRDLIHKLGAEYPAILRWTIDGCLHWQAEGLAVPAVIRNATDSYLADQDTLGEWLDEKVKPDPFGFTLTTDLFFSWKCWCEARNISPGTERSLSEALQGRALEKAKHPSSRRRGYRVSLTEQSR